MLSWSTYIWYYVYPAFLEVPTRNPCVWQKARLCKCHYIIFMCQIDVLLDIQEFCVTFVTFVVWGMDVHITQMTWWLWYPKHISDTILYAVVIFRVCVCVTSDLVCNSIVLSFIRHEPYYSVFNSPILDDLSTDHARPFAMACNLVSLWLACYSQTSDYYMKLQVQNASNSLFFRWIVKALFWISLEQ